MSSVPTGMAGRLSLPADNSLTLQRSAKDAPVTPGKRMPIVDKTKVDPQVVKAAEGMEAMFLDYLMKVMRDTVPENGLELDSPATKIYRGMMDSETAKTAAQTGGVGLADQLIAYMVGQEYTKPMSGQGAPQPLPKEGSKP